MSFKILCEVWEWGFDFQNASWEMYSRKIMLKVQDFKA